MSARGRRGVRTGALGLVAVCLAQGAHAQESAPPFESLQSAPAPRATLAVEREDNDTFGTANGIAASGVVRGTIAPEDDSDWYVFEVGRHGALDIAFDAPPAALDMAMRVWTAEKSPLSSWMKAAAPGADLAETVDLPAPGRYTIEVRDSGDDARAAEAYTMALRFTPSADSYEPNGTYGTGRRVPTDGVITGTILPEDDVDWYCLIAFRHGALDLEMIAPPPALDMTMRLWTSEKSPLSGWMTAAAAGADLVETVDIPRPGEYCLEVRDSGDDARAIAPYNLRLAFTPSVDDFEPNNAFGVAAPIALGTAVQATILPEDDVDWYLLEAPLPGQLDIEVTEVDAALDVTYRVWTAEKSPLTSWYAPLRAGAETIAVVDLARAGHYWLEVRDSSDDARAIAPYRLTTAFTPAPDAFEPNNSFGAAARVGANTSVRATILPEDDIDWYAVDVPRPGQLALSVPIMPAALDVVFRVWTAEKSPMTGWFAPNRAGGVVEALVDLPATGRYWVEVRDSGDDARAIEPYLLVLGFTPSP